MTAQTVNGTNETIRELTESLHNSDNRVDKLTEMLEKSENRSRSIERNIRWMGVALLGLGLIMISYTSSNFITQAQAKSDVVQAIENRLEGKDKQLEQRLQELMKFLQNLNGMVENMNHLTKYLSIEDWKVEEPKTLTAVVEKLLSSDPLLEEELKQVKKAGGGAITYLFTEAAKGLGHIDNLGKQIVSMNQNMVAMNQNMLEMNRNMHNMSVNMGVMSYDINSTMGRMGRAIPWMP